MHSGSTLLAIGNSHAHYVQFILNSVSEKHKDAFVKTVHETY